MTGPAIARDHGDGQAWTCPRCGERVDTFPAISRTGDPERDPIEICAACGADETALHQDGSELPARDRWPVERQTGAAGA